MNRILITGGLGFIGFHLTMELIKKKSNQVIIFDAEKHFIPNELSQWSFFLKYRKKLLVESKQVEIIKGDCNNTKLLKETIEKHKPHKIVHLAALSIAGISNDNPEKAKVNIFDNTLSLLEAIKESGIFLENFIYISSSMAYGNFRRDADNNIIPAIENQICNPIGLYGVMKLNAENLVKTYNHRFGMPYTIIRPSAVYGPTDCNLRVTEIFINRALEGEEIVLDNGGNHQLDFTYIDDLVQGLTLVLNSEKVKGETLNISTGKGISIKELAEIIKDIIHSTKIVEGTILPYRPNRGAQNILKAKDLLGYKPSFDLKSGIENYIKFIKSIKK